MVDIIIQLAEGVYHTEIILSSKKKANVFHSHIKEKIDNLFSIFFFITSTKKKSILEVWKRHSTRHAV